MRTIEEIPAGYVEDLERRVERAEAEVMLFRKGIADYLDGNYKSARSYRPGKCPHEVWYFNECEACNDAYFQSLLVAPHG